MLGFRWFSMARSVAESPQGSMAEVGCRPQGLFGRGLAARWVFNGPYCLPPVLDVDGEKFKALWAVWIR